MTSEILLSAIALMLIFEGIAPLLFPNRWRNFMLLLANEKATSIRQIGLLLVGCGTLLWFAVN